MEELLKYGFEYNARKLMYKKIIGDFWIEVWESENGCTCYIEDRDGWVKVRYNATPEYVLNLVKALEGK